MKFQFISSISLASAIITENAQCDFENIPTQADFDQSKYTGTWYSTFEDFRNWNSPCVTATYTPMENGDIKVYNRAWTWFFYYGLTGSATCGTDGKCWVTFNWWGSRPDTTKVPNYNIISTDYDNYAFVYSCDNLSDNKKRESAWILTRTPKISDEKLKEYKMMLKIMYPTLDQSEMKTVLQGPACDYV